MELRLQRLLAVGDTLMGDLLVDGGGHLCTLENAAHQIPVGRYRVLLTVSGRASRGELWSPRRDFVLPLIAGVPGRDGIRIHAGNAAGDSSGCVLVGQARTVDRLVHAQLALSNLMDRLEAATSTIWLAVCDPAPAFNAPKTKGL
jgi:Steigviridae/Suoliviridae L,D-carboxypeptidase/transpeptidase